MTARGGGSCTAGVPVNRRHSTHGTAEGVGAGRTGGDRPCAGGRGPGGAAPRRDAGGAVDPAGAVDRAAAGRRLVRAADRRPVRPGATAPAASPRRHVRGAKTALPAAARARLPTAGPLAGFGRRDLAGPVVAGAESGRRHGAGAGGGGRGPAGAAVARPVDASPARGTPTVADLGQGPGRADPGQRAAGGAVAGRIATGRSAGGLGRAGARRRHLAVDRAGGELPQLHQLLPATGRRRRAVSAGAVRAEARAGRPVPGRTPAVPVAVHAGPACTAVLAGQGSGLRA